MIPYIDIHTHNFSEKDNVISVKNVFLQENQTPCDTKDSLVSVGLHPWHIGEWDIKKTKEFLNFSYDKFDPIAIGETGLDRTIKASFEMQTDLFIEHAKFAEHLGLPVILHCVKSYYDMISIKKKLSFKNPWIFHGFNGNMQILKKALNYNFYFSFGYSVLQSKKLQQILTNIPLERLFLETDDSDADIIEIYTFVSDFLKIDEDKLKEQIFNNFNNIRKTTNELD